MVHNADLSRAAYWRMQRLFDRPSSMYSAIDCGVIDSKNMAGFGQTYTMSFYRYVDACSPIPSLSKFCSPVTIFREISKVIIAAFEGMFGCWARANIGKEVGEFKPALANSYSPATVIMESRISRVLAALAHAFPASVFEAAFPVCRMSVRGGYACRQAPAASGDFFSKVRRGGRYLISAITSTFPSSITVLVISRPLHYGQAAIPLSKNIDKPSIFLSGIRCANKFICGTPATFRMSTRQMAGRCNDYFSALTSTFPLRMSMCGSFGAAENKQVPVFETNPVN